jgi:hypothetical protein
MKMNEMNLTVFVCDNCGQVALAANRGADCSCGGTYSMQMHGEADPVNLTPHVIRLNDGREFPPSGVVARVSARYQERRDSTLPMYQVVYGAVTGLPEYQEHARYIVSGMVAAACPDRLDLLIPATGHPYAVRVDGQVYSVPGFIIHRGNR